MHPTRRSLSDHVRLIVGCGVLGCSPQLTSAVDTSSGADTSSAATTGSASADSGSATASTETGTGDACMAAANRAACEGSIPMLQASDAGDVPTGLERCVDGRYHIVSVETCQFPASVTGSCSDQRVVECRVDRDCGPLAFCNGVTKGLNSTCECQQACISDDDCDPGFACLCAGEYTSCVEAHCRTDADCDGGLCRLATDATDCERSVLACERVGSTCADHSACGECEQCMYVGERCAFECVELTGICAAGCQ